MGAGQSVGAVKSFAAMQRLTDLAVEESYPEATHVLLEQSDQGKWLELTGWCHGDEGDVQEFTEDWEEDLLGAPSHLYTCHIGSSVEQSAVPGLWCTDRRSGRYVLEVATVLAMVEPQEPVLEVLTVRDPDGPTHVEALVLGRSVSTVEVSVDAGAGWAWADWCAHRKASFARVSEAFRPTVLEAFTDPPGGRYVCGRGEDPWVPQDAGGSTTGGSSSSASGLRTWRSGRIRPGSTLMARGLRPCSVLPGTGDAPGDPPWSQVRQGPTCARS